MSALTLEAPPERRGKRKKEKPRERKLEGHVERVQLHDRFLQVRFGKEPGDYLILYIPRGCRIHCAGDQIPLKDVQFCDSVSVSYHRHYRFDVQLAQEVEVR